MFDIITAFTDNYKPLFDLSEPALTHYCQKNSYIKHIYTIPDNYHRPASWYKIEKLLDHTTTNTGFSLWLDVDTMIINSNFDLKSLVVDDKFIYISKDMNNINAGVVMIQNNEYCNSFLQKVWDSTEYLNHCWWEQAAIVNLIDQNYMNITNHIEYVPQNIFNAYEYAFYGYSEHPGEVDHNSFIFHCPALSYEVRWQLLKKYKILNESLRTNLY